MARVAVPNAMGVNFDGRGFVSRKKNLPMPGTRGSRVLRDPRVTTRLDRMSADIFHPLSPQPRKIVQRKNVKAARNVQVRTGG
jgi:hypothetical protein